jgi:large subunit ribosomal protein L15
MLQKNKKNGFVKLNNMNLSQLPSVSTKKKRRLGQGHGSGRVKTAGRGTKGLKARGKVSLSFEGGGLPLIKRLPFLRGKGRNQSLKDQILVVNTGTLNLLPKGTKVSIDTLISHRIIKKTIGKQPLVKILGDGDLTVSLTVLLPVSKGAREKIINAGGSVTVGEQ